MDAQRVAIDSAVAADAPTAAASVSNHLRGDRRPVLEAALIALGQGDVAQMRRNFNSACVRINGIVDRKLRKHLVGAPGIVIEILAPPIDDDNATDADAGEDVDTNNDEAAASLSSSSSSSSSTSTTSAYTLERTGFARGTRPVFDRFGSGRAVLHSTTVRATTLMMNKPDMCVTAMRDAEHRTVLDVLRASSAWRDGMEHHVRPMGRLDLNTTGLLLWTDDGDLNRRALLPEFHVPKRYACTLRDDATQADADAFAEGVTIALPQGKQRACQPAAVRINPDDARDVEMEIGEGAHHQVKRMWALRGNRIEALRRVAIGALRLDESLAPGEVRRLTDDEERQLYRDAQFEHAFFALCIPPAATGTVLPSVHS